MKHDSWLKNAKIRAWFGVSLAGALVLGGCSGDGATGADLNMSIGPSGLPGAPSPSGNPYGGSTGSLVPTSQAAQVAVPILPVEERLSANDPVVDEDTDEAQTVEIAVNPFTSTSSDPFSTFAADVDTASYDLFRSSVTNAHTLPSPSSVRTEEFVNYFDYGYVAPSTEDEHPFSIHLAATADYFDTPRTILRVGIQAREPIAFEKKPTNVAFLVDTSGSMEDPLKLPLVQAVLTEALKVLDPEDQVAVVTYGGSTGVSLASTPAANASQIQNVIDNLGASGGTNGAQGIQLAYDQVRSNFIEGGINHVILCTDGDFNVGPSTISELVELIEEERKSGITFTALGFGVNPNDAMMEEISNKGNGTYAIIGSEEQAKEYAEERLLSTLQMVAKDLKIQVEFNTEQVYAYRLLGYENRAIADEDFRDDLVDAGEVGAGHRVTAIYELALNDEQLPEGAEVSAGESSDEPREVSGEDLVLVKVRYKDVEADESDAAYEVRRALSVGDLTEPDEDLQWAAGVAAFAEVLRGSPLVDPAILDQVQAVVERQADRDAERAEFLELLLLARPMIETP